VHGLTPLGSTGEFAYLNADQRTAVVKTTIEATRRRMPVVAGVVSTATSDAVAQARTYERLGADGILAILEVDFPLADAQVESYLADQRGICALYLGACITAGLAIQGYDVGDPVPPQVPLTAEQRRAVEAVLSDIS
jgi:dihydrodipicolinate synthase/N-acetylneuraminate lyase